MVRNLKLLWLRVLAGCEQSSKNKTLGRWTRVREKQALERAERSSIDNCGLCFKTVTYGPAKRPPKQSVPSDLDDDFMRPFLV